MADKKIDHSSNTGTKEASVVEEKSATQTASTVKNAESANGTTAAPTDNGGNVTPARDPSAKRRISFKKFVPIVVLLLAAGILLGITGVWNRFVGGGSTQRTDDALLRADITPLSTRVSGTVAQVAVADYQKVKAGDLLVQLKDDDFKAQVGQAEAGVAAAQAALANNAKQKELQDARIWQAQAGTQAASADIVQSGAAINGAEADVDNAQAAVEAAQAKIPDAEAAVAAAQADAERSRLERQRQEALVEMGAATKQKLEQVVADQERFAAILDSRKAELTQARAYLESKRAEVSKTHAGVASRQAERLRAQAQSSGKSAEVEAQIKQRAVLDAQEQQLQADLNVKQEALKIAQTNLDYTRIVAPTDGIVGERKVRIGQLVSPGTQVISLVDNTVWVQANYEETQLTNVSKGDGAEVTVDTFPGITLRGHVEEIAPASGSQFALLPPDNATGNYTKIVQRIPVKIVLDARPELAERLRPGMSVIAKIRTKARKV
ncbi:MAG TPA: HlyD family secretion protein [Pyrinomonadaceae bacterium]|nr:HlyD family secretion protein [Pyrinomonadaceae bacterium]